MLKLTESLDETHPSPSQPATKLRPKKPRSPAQRAASRRNGRKSRGPKTAQGKAVSRRNAIRHGLRAETLSPPHDVRGLDRAYKHHVAELTREFKPRTYSEHLLIADLARDYQRRDLCNHLLDIVEMPPAFRDAKLTEEYERHERAERDACAAGDLLAALRSGETPECDADTAYRLADQFAALVEQVDQDFSDEAADELAELVEREANGQLEPDDAAELAELREWEALARVIKPRRRMLRDDARLAELFRGERRVARRELRALIMLAAEIYRHAAEKAATTRRVLDCLRKAVDQQHHVLAYNPKLLFDLQAYGERISRAVARKTRELRQLCK